MDRRRRTLVFKVRLRDIEPAIWRQIEVPATYSFWDLHVAIQDAMGWKDYHLHAFRVRRPSTDSIDEIGIPDPDLPRTRRDFLPGWELSLTDYFTGPADPAEYEYDFGDGWVHDLVLDSIGIRHAKTKYPRCLGGARACPPEDCGGPHGYAMLLQILANPSHEQHEDMVEWVGGALDPEAFHLRAVRFANPKTRWRNAFSSR